MLYPLSYGCQWAELNFCPYKLSNLKFTPLPSLHVDFYSRHDVNNVLFFLHNCPLLIPLHNTAVLIKICRFFLSTLLNLCKPLRNWTFQRFARAAHKKASALDMPRTWVRVLASVRFFHLFRCVLSYVLSLRSVGRSNFVRVCINLTTLIKKQKKTTYFNENCCIM